MHYHKSMCNVYFNASYTYGCIGVAFSKYDISIQISIHFRNIKTVSNICIVIKFVLSKSNIFLY